MRVLRGVQWVIYLGDTLRVEAAFHGAWGSIVDKETGVMKACRPLQTTVHGRPAQPRDIEAALHSVANTKRAQDILAAGQKEVTRALVHVGWTFQEADTFFRRLEANHVSPDNAGV
jgi:hypothetical protein